MGEPVTTLARKRRWLVCAILIFAVVAVGGFYLPAALESQDRRLEKLERTAYMLDGTIDTESERGKGMFTDEELDSIKAHYEQRKRLPSLAPDSP